tara:strand:- start:1275 stop:2507 length:1233 start_codon:yes stop_codon:yes gene_type:complete
MALTSSEKGVWSLDEVYNKINAGGIWTYNEFNTGWAWGEQDYGELGANSGGTRYASPHQIGTDITWSEFGMRNPYGDGKSQALWIKSDGTMWSAGRNKYGILGLNSPTNQMRSSPTQIGTDTDWATATGATLSKIAIKTDGTMWTWGRNYYGSFGRTNADPNYFYRSSPIQLPGTWSNVQASCVGNLSTVLATKPDGTLWGWGRQADGQLGQNQPSGANYSSPVQIPAPGPPSTTWQTERGKFSAGGKCCYMINTDDELWITGEGSWGRSGTNNETQYSSPVQVPGTWSYIEGGSGNGYGIRTDGTLWSWGQNQEGLLGLNEPGSPGNVYRSSPTQIGTATDWTKIVAGAWATYAFRGNDLYSWGPNSNGILGLGPGEPGRSSPTQIPGVWTTLAAAGEAVWANKIAPPS